jgi:hypothetical protein
VINETRWQASFVGTGHSAFLKTQFILRRASSFRELCWHKIRYRVLFCCNPCFAFLLLRRASFFQLSFLHTTQFFFLIPDFWLTCTIYKNNSNNRNRTQKRENLFSFVDQRQNSSKMLLRFHRHQKVGRVKNDYSTMHKIPSLRRHFFIIKVLSIIYYLKNNKFF